MTTFNKIISWNINSAFQKLAYLQILTYDIQPAVICFQETKLPPERKFSLKNYNILRQDLTNIIRAKGGTALAVHQNFRSEPIQLNTPYQGVATKVFFPHSVSICSLYFHQDDNVTIQDMDELISQLPLPFIITGDFNAHNSLWSSNRNNFRGLLIEQFLAASSISLLNDGNATHLCTHTGTTSAIDLSICDSTLIHQLEWTTSSHPYSSDYFPQIIEMLNTLPANHRNYSQWILNKVDWNAFTTDLNLSAAFENHTAENINAVITNSFIMTAHKYIHQTPRSIQIDVVSLGGILYVQQQ